MKNRNVALLAAGLLIASWGVAKADDMATPAAAPSAASTSKPGVLNAIAMSVTATVVDINYNTRMLTLKGPDGQTQTMQAGPEVTRFNGIHKGDTVNVDYMESVALMVHSPTEGIQSAEGSSTAVIRSTGTKPSGVVVQTNMATVTVDKIDVPLRRVTVTGPQGNTMTLDVAPDVPNLENVKVGDHILVKYTRTIAIHVTKTPKKS